MVCRPATRGDAPRDARLSCCGRCNRLPLLGLPVGVTVGGAAVAASPECQTPPDRDQRERRQAPNDNAGNAAARQAAPIVVATRAATAGTPPTAARVGPPTTATDWAATPVEAGRAASGARTMAAPSASAESLATGPDRRARTVRSTAPAGMSLGGVSKKSSTSAADRLAPLASCG